MKKAGRVGLFFKGMGILWIKKVINNNMLCVVEKKGQEMIVTGKGIGFKKKIGDPFDPSLIEKSYRMEGKVEQRKLRELVEQIPQEHLRLTQDLIQYIKSQISLPLNESLLITLADHINFAIRRKNEGVEFHNPMEGEIMCYYPAEYRLGQHCLKEIRRETKSDLSDGEAAFIALHIVNAELNTEMSMMYDITKLIEDTMAIVENYYRKTFDRESLDFGRFVVHLRFFAQRLFQNKSLGADHTEEDSFHQMIAYSCKNHYQCALCIADYVRGVHQKELTTEELTYLTIHLKRINVGQG